MGILLTIQSPLKSRFIASFFCSQGEAWWNLRKPAQDHIMKPSAVRSYIPIISEVANDFVASLKDTPVIEDCLKSLINVSTECKSASLLTFFSYFS